MMRRVAVLALVALSLAACAPGEGARPRTVTLIARYSRFQPSHLTVAAGTTVRFVVENRDPIAHELIVGDREVQDLHETGRGHHHGAVPGEISAPSGSVVETTYTFDRPGEILFGCHLPGHYAYGMRGTIRVV
jgi:uncharacterized cupredoxin-like copper-binding protein